MKKVRVSKLIKIFRFLRELIIGHNRYNYYFKDKYFRNLRSGEIHNMSNLKLRCNSDEIKNGEYLTRFDLDQYLIKSNMIINYCKHCN